MEHGTVGEHPALMRSKTRLLYDMTKSRWRFISRETFLTVQRMLLLHHGYESEGSGEHVCFDGTSTQVLQGGRRVQDVLVEDVPQARSSSLTQPCKSHDSVRLGHPSLMRHHHVFPIVTLEIRRRDWTIVLSMNLRNMTIKDFSSPVVRDTSTANNSSHC